MDIQSVIETWKEVCREKGYVLNTKFSQKHGKYLYEIAAKLVVINGGRCPCLPREREKCPCNEMDDDISKTGSCYCKVFYRP